MDTKEFVELMKFKFKLNLIHVHIRYKNRVLVDMEKSTLSDVARFLFCDLGFRFIIASGTDIGKTFEIVYHFSNDKTGLIANVRVRIPKQKPEVASLTPLFVAADWIEREMHELFGIVFEGHPEMRSLLSDGNWDANEFPMKKPLDHER